MAKGLHNKHISTQWGVAILGFFVIVIALLIPVLNQSQTSQSHAMYQPGQGGHGKVTCSSSGCYCNLARNFVCGGGLRCRTYIVSGTNDGKSKQSGKYYYNASVDINGQCYR